MDNNQLLVRQLDYIRELQTETDIMYDDIQRYRVIIKRLIKDLQRNDNKECKNVYHRCINTRTYQSLNWGSSDEED